MKSSEPIVESVDVEPSESVVETDSSNRASISIPQLPVAIEPPDSI